MKLATVLVVGLAVCRLTAAKEEEATPKKDAEGSSRQMRFLLNWLSGPAALAGAGVSSLGETITNFGNSLSGNTKSSHSPKIIYVARPQQQSCPLPYFTRGCPSGHFCDISSGKNRCVPQYPDGAGCKTGYQCVSKKCRDDYCVEDQCEVAGETSNCPRGQECVKTKKGYRCEPMSAKDECPTPLEHDGCDEDYYCAGGKMGNKCKPKLQVDDRCVKYTQCQSGKCRNGKCKADACPLVDMSVDCMPSQYCSVGEKGNMCVAKKDNGEHCTDDNQCKHNSCERGKCVRDECPVPYMPGRCPPSQFCSPMPLGNVCMNRRDVNQMCDNDDECKSRFCDKHTCKANDCPEPLSTRGCNMMTQFCARTSNGRECVNKLADGAECVNSVQCVNVCMNGRCASTMLANGQPCSAGTQCSSQICVLDRCAASRNGVGGVCRVADDCESRTCTNMMCAPAVDTTTAAADTTTTMSTTTMATTTLAPLMAACTMDSECESMRCVDMMCAPMQVSIGTMCTAPTDCLSNTCTDGVCQQGDVEGGEPCTSSEQCASAACINDVCFAPP